MQECLAEGDRLLGRGGLGEREQQPWPEMNRAFHAAIADAAQNRTARYVHWYRLDDANDVIARSRAGRLNGAAFGPYSVGLHSGDLA